MIFFMLNRYLVGIIGNQGKITEYGADKGANFVQLCDDKDIPIIFLQNTEESNDTSESGTHI